MMVVFTGCGSKDDSSSDSGSGEQTEFQKAKASLDKNLKADEIDKDKCKGNSYGLILSSLGKNSGKLREKVQKLLPKITA